MTSFWKGVNWECVLTQYARVIMYWARLSLWGHRVPTRIRPKTRISLWGRTVGTYFWPIPFLNPELKLILLVPPLKMSPLGHMYPSSPHKVHTEFSIFWISRNLSWNSVDLCPHKVCSVPSTHASTLSMLGLELVHALMVPTKSPHHMYIQKQVLCWVLLGPIRQCWI